MPRCLSVRCQAHGHLVLHALHKDTALHKLRLVVRHIPRKPVIFVLAWPMAVHDLCGLGTHVPCYIGFPPVQVALDIIQNVESKHTLLLPYPD